MSEAAGTLYIFSEITDATNCVALQKQVHDIKTGQRDTIQAKTDSVKPKPTPEQIRYWQWLREKRIKIQGSRYIRPKKDVKLITTLKPDDIRLGLPIREKSTFNTDWITILIVLALILFATVRATSSKYISDLFQSLVNYNTSFRMFREKNYPISHGATQLNIIFYFTFSLFLFQVENAFGLKLASNSFLFFLVSLSIVLGYFFMKKIAYSALGLVFEGTAETNEYLFNIDVFNRILGIVLFPIVALINYYPADNPLFMVYTGIFTVGVFYAFLLQRGISILLKKQFSIFYLFLYLCTLEFLPLLLIYKVVVI
jgi:hypothetical protein